MPWPHFLSKYNALLSGLLLFTLFFYLYAATTPAHPTGYADSEEIVTVAVTGGVAQPPGYGLLTTVLGLMIKVSPFSPIYTANLSSALFQALALMILFWAIAVMLSGKKELSTRQVFIASAAGVTITGLSQILWLTATRIEISAFASFTIALWFWSYAKWQQQVDRKGNHYRYFFLTLITFGVSLSHLQTVVFYLPGMLAALLVNFSVVKKHYLKPHLIMLGVATLSFSFFLPNTLLLAQNNTQADVSWYFPPTLEGWLGHITRRDYSGTFLDQSTERNAYWAGLPPYFYSMIPVYPKFVAEHVHLYAISLLVVAIWYLIAAKQWRYLPWLLFFLSAGMVLFAYMGIPPDDGTIIERDLLIGVGERQYIVGYLMLAPLLALAFFALFKEGNKRHIPLTTQMVIVSICASVIIWPMYQNHSRIVAGANTPIIDEYTRTVLASVKPNSVIVCSADIACFPLIYLSRVENKRPDVDILFQSPRPRHYYLKQNPHLYNMVYEENPDFVTNLIAWNLQNRPVYHTNPTDYYINYMGLNGNPFYLIPSAYAFEITPTLPKKPPLPFHHGFSLELLKKQPDLVDYYARGLPAYISTLHTLSGTLYLNYGEFEMARQQFELSLALTPNYRIATQWLTLLPEYTEADTYRAKPSMDMRPSLVQELINQDQLDQAYALGRKSLYINPFDYEMRLLVADLLIKGGYLREAKRELDQILKFDPNNELAKQRLDLL
jgi:tetratricopeptide (TPR) repeat protein